MRPDSTAHAKAADKHAISSLGRVELIDADDARFRGPAAETLRGYFDRVNDHAATAIARLAGSR